VPRRWICATSVVRAGNRLTKAISKQSRPTGLRRADASSGPFGHVQPTATSANIQGNGMNGSGPPNRQSLQPVPLLRLHRLPHLHLFVVLGPDGDPIVKAAIGLRPNSHQSNICELLDDAILSHQFAAAGLTRSCRWICHQVLINRCRRTHQNGWHRQTLDSRGHRAANHNGQGRQNSRPCCVP